MLPDEEASVLRITKEHAAQLGRMDALTTGTLSLIPAKEFRIDAARDTDQHMFVVSLGLLVKAIKTFRGISHLCAMGLSQDSRALLRVLFETWLAMHFVLRRSSRLRARMFFVHRLASTITTLKRQKQTKGLKRTVAQSRIADVEDQLAQVADAVSPFIVRAPVLSRKWYGKGVVDLAQLLTETQKGDKRDAVMRQLGTKLEAVMKKHWSGKDLRTVAVSLNAEVAYETFYRYASTFSHAADALIHTSLTTDGITELKLIPEWDGECDRTVGTSSGLLWSMAELFDEKFKLGHANILKALKPFRVTNPG